MKTSVIENINLYYTEKLKVLENETFSGSFSIDGKEAVFTQAELNLEIQMTKAVIDLTVEALALKMTIEQVKELI